MKAKEIMEKYSITRNTLSNWVKRGWIKVKTLPSGRYIYIDIKNNNVESNNI
jgi:predicted site-specific integrase-resolvase